MNSHLDSFYNALRRLHGIDFIYISGFAAIFFLALTPSSHYPLPLTAPVLHTSIAVSLAAAVVLAYICTVRSSVIQLRPMWSQFYYLMPVMIGVSMHRFGIEIWTIYFGTLFVAAILACLLATNRPAANCGIRGGLVVTLVLLIPTIAFYGKKQPTLLLNPNILAMFIAAALPFVVGQARRLYVVGTLYAAASLVVIFLGSRTGAIGLLVGLLAIVYARRATFFDRRQSGFTQRLAIITALAATLFAALAFYHHKKSESTVGRQVIWENTACIIARQPVLGYGIGSYQKVLGEQLMTYFSEPRPMDVQDNFYQQISIAYNDPLQLVVENGLLGALIWLSLLYGATRAFSDPDRCPAATTVLCGLVMSLTNSFWYAPPCALLIVMAFSLTLPSTSTATLSVGIQRTVSAMGAVFALVWGAYILRYDSAIRTAWDIRHHTATRPQENLRQLHSLLPTLSSNDGYWMIVADNFYNAGRYTDALQAVNKSIELSGSAKAYALRSWIYRDIHLDSLSCESLRIVHTIVPGNPTYAYALFESCLVNRDSVAAGIIAEKLIGYTKNNAPNVKRYQEKASLFLYGK